MLELLRPLHAVLLGDLVPAPTGPVSDPYNVHAAVPGIADPGGTVANATATGMGIARSLTQVGSATFQERMQSVTQGAAAVSYQTAWGLLTLCFLLALAYQQVQAVAGRKPDHGIVVSRAILAAAALAIYSSLTEKIWEATSGLAQTIYDENQRRSMGTLVEAGVTRVWTTAVANGIPIVGTLYNVRNLAVDFLMMCSLWASSFALDGLATIQVCVYNVLFCVGPLLIALSVLGLPTGTFWLTAVLEICSWSVTGAVVQVTMYQRFLKQFAGAASQGPLNLEWWDALKEMGFLCTLVVAVPIITSRFLGIAALGELSRVSIGSTASTAMASTFARWGTLGGSVGNPGMAPNPSQDVGAAERPGD